jgi:hypothetical protein
MGHIFIKTAALSITGYAIYRVVLNSAPTTEVTRQVFAAPHPERGVTFSPLQPVMHQVQLWESINGTSLTTLLATIDVDASINNELQFEIIELVVDRGNAGLVAGDTGDPADNTDTYLDARLKGQLYAISQRLTGQLRMDEYTDLSSGHGGFQFTTVSGQYFRHGDTWFVTIYKTTSVQTPPGNQFSVKIEASDVNIISTYYNKLVLATASGDVQLFTFPAGSTIPDNTLMSFSTAFGSYKYLKLQLHAGDSIRFNGVDKNAIYLALDERIDLIWSAGIAYVLKYDGRAKQRGNLYGDVMQRVATHAADGSQYPGSQYPGLFDWLINEAPTELKVNNATWNSSVVTPSGETVYPYKGLWAVESIAGTFNFPLAAGMAERYILPGDSERTPNVAMGYQHHEIYSHDHDMLPTGGPGINMKVTSAGTSDLMGGSKFKQVENLRTGASGGTETRGKNLGKLALIIL